MAKYQVVIWTDKNYKKEDIEDEIRFILSNTCPDEQDLVVRVTNASYS